jgi:heterodisulfide reductase subunit C
MAARHLVDARAQSKVRAGLQVKMNWLALIIERDVGHLADFLALTREYRCADQLSTKLGIFCIECAWCFGFCPTRRCQAQQSDHQDLGDVGQHGFDAN